jgi:hypothetical protein
MSMALCVFTHVLGWLSVSSSITVYAPSVFCGSSHMYWGLLLSCHVDERRVDVLCRGYSQDINTTFIYTTS